MNRLAISTITLRVIRPAPDPLGLYFRMRIALGNLAETPQKRSVSVVPTRNIIRVAHEQPRLSS